MVEYSKANGKLLQLNKLKTALRNNSGTFLRMSLKIFDGNNLTHELLLTTKLRNAFNNTVSTNIKLS